MESVSSRIADYLCYCQLQKRLSPNTMRAYHIDMNQFIDFLRNKKKDHLDVINITKDILKEYLERLQGQYAAKTCKRKIACLKAFFNHLELEDIIQISPFRKLRIKISESRQLPKTIKKQDIAKQLEYIYSLSSNVATPFQEFQAAQTIVCYEILINTGMRIGELCKLNDDSIDLDSHCIRITGKGGKERIAYLTEKTIEDAIRHYIQIKERYHITSPHFFVNWWGNPIKEGSARRMIRNIAKKVLNKRITPHMFRHTFASMLLELNVDIRYIQELLGHSSINTTQIYLHLLNTSIRASLERANLRKQFSY